MNNLDSLRLKNLAIFFFSESQIHHQKATTMWTILSWKRQKNASKQRSLHAPHLERDQIWCKRVVSLRGFPCNTALFWLVSYNDPCLQESPIDTPETKLQHKFTHLMMDFFHQLGGVFQGSWNILRREGVSCQATVQVRLLKLTPNIYPVSITIFWKQLGSSWTSFHSTCLFRVHQPTSPNPQLLNLRRCWSCNSWVGGPTGPPEPSLGGSESKFVATKKISRFVAHQGWRFS